MLFLPTRVRGAHCVSNNFICAGLCNRVGKVYLPLLAARPACCVSSKFPYAGLRIKKVSQRNLRYFF